MVNPEVRMFVKIMLILTLNRKKKKTSIEMSDNSTAPIDCPVTSSFGNQTILFD